MCAAEVLALHGRLLSQLSECKVAEKKQGSEPGAMARLCVASERIQALIKDAEEASYAKASEGQAGCCIRLGEEMHRCLPNLRMLRCEVLNDLGNLCKRLGRFEEAQRHYLSAMQADGKAADRPSFYSHNLGLALVELCGKNTVQESQPAAAVGDRSCPTGEDSKSKSPAAANEADQREELLSSAVKHLLRAVEERSRVAQSKSFQSVVRLCDTHRTLQRAMAMFGSGQPPTAAAAGAVAADEGRRLHRGRLMALSMLRRCARTWDDRKCALVRLGDWMRHVSLFSVRASLGRHWVKVQWRLSSDEASAPLVENPAFFENENPSRTRRLSSDEASAPLVENPAFFQIAEAGGGTAAELGAEMLRTLATLRLESLDSGTAVDFLLAVDPATVALGDIAAECAAGRLRPGRFVAAVAALRAVVRGQDGGAGGRGLRWRQRVAQSLRAKLAAGAAPHTLWSPTGATSCPASPCARGLRQVMEKQDWYTCIGPLNTLPGLCTCARKTSRPKSRGPSCAPPSHRRQRMLPCDPGSTLASPACVAPGGRTMRQAAVQVGRTRRCYWPGWRRRSRRQT